MYYLGRKIIKGVYNSLDIEERCDLDVLIVCGRNIVICECIKFMVFIRVYEDRRVFKVCIYYVRGLYVILFRICGKFLVLFIYFGF